MSLFSKSPKEGGVPKPDPQGTKVPAPSPARTTVQRAPAPPHAPHAMPARPSPPPPKPAQPHGPAPAVAPRTVDAGNASRSRPAMPAIAIGPPAAPPLVVASAPAAPAAFPAPVTSSPVVNVSAAKPPPHPGLDQAPAVGSIGVASDANAGTHRAAPEPPLKATRVEPSVRPTAPNLTDADGAHVSIADTFERLLSLDDLDEGFASIEGSADTTGSHALALTDLAEVRALFAQLAVNHVRQVRDFMIDLRWRDATLDWIGICEPALRSLRRAADKLELRELCAALDRFSEALTATQASGGRTIDGGRRDGLLARYEELCVLMPQAFALDLDRTQREAVILQSLLLQVPEVKKVTLDKLYAAGLTTLEALFLATPADIASTTGIAESLAARIVERFRACREQVNAAVPDATRAHERERVAELTARLRREHDEHERAAQLWTREADEKRKTLRRSRAQTLLDIQVVLARLGEVERLNELERLPFERKVAHLETFLEEAREKYVAQS
jgi:DNA repair protein RadA